MVTGTEIAVEINEAAAMNSVTAKDEIKRNHLQMLSVKPVVADMRVTELTVKFARLKKALRKRSSTIF